MASTPKRGTSRPQSRCDCFHPTLQSGRGKQKCLSLSVIFLYQTDHAMEKVASELRLINAAYRPVKVRPHFHMDAFPFIEHRDEKTFRFGRLSRADPGKFHPSQLWIYEAMVA